MSANLALIKHLQEHPQDHPQLKDLMQRVIQALVEAEVALADAAAERDHFRGAFGKVANELEAVIGVTLARYKLNEFVLTSKDVQQYRTRGLTLHVGDRDRTTRVYRCVPKGEGKRTKIDTAVDQAMKH